MRLYLGSLLISALCSGALAACAGAGQKAKECGGNRKSADFCCQDQGLECSGQWCQAVDDNGGGGENPACPSELKTGCFAWVCSGGRKQALHVLSTVVDGNGAPVNDARVTMITKEAGVPESPFVSDTSAYVFGNYEDEFVEQCGEVIQGVSTNAKCWQKAKKGVKYEAEVMSITMDNCPDAVFNPVDNTDEYDFPGRQQFRG